MSVDGLRAWIGEVERKLGKRTRVFLVLVAIAVGGGAAAIYLAVEAQEDSVSKADVQAVRDELEGRIGTAGDLTQLEAELRALRAEVARLKEEGSASKRTGGNSGKSAKEGAAGEGATGSTAAESPGAGSNHLLESLEKAKEQAGK